MTTRDEELRLGEALAAFAREYELSARALSHVCGGPQAGVSKSTADRLKRGQAGVQLTPERRGLVASNLRDYLIRRGVSASRINQTICSIFPEEVNILVPRTSLPFSVCEFFGLRRDPFDPVKSDPRSADEAFTTPALDRTLAALEDAVNFQGFAALVGDVGSGKTQLKKRLVQRVLASDGRVRVLFPDFSEMKRVNPSAVVSFVLEHFGQRPRRGLVAAYEQMRSHLAYLSDQGVRVALAFDEAHRLNDEEMSALKNFWELSNGGYQRFLGVVLFGQRSFVSRLEDARFREIAERVEIIEMPGLGKHSFDYIAHRVRLAGGEAERIFEKKAVERLAAQADTPLALGNLANAALLKAFSMRERKVLAALVAERRGQEPSARVIRRAS